MANIDYTKYTISQIAKDLMDDNNTDLLLQKIAGQKLLDLEKKLPKPLTPKELEDLAKTIKASEEYDKADRIRIKQLEQKQRMCEYVQIAVPFELRTTTKLDTPFYPTLQDVIKLNKPVEASMDTEIKITLEQVVRMSHKDLTIEKYKQLKPNNPQIDALEIYYPKQQIYSSKDNQGKIESIGDLSFDTLETRQKKILEWQAKDNNQSVRFTIADFYNPIVFQVKTGITKDITAVLTGSFIKVGNNTIAQATLK
jgi:hypothetical protein